MKLPATDPWLVPMLSTIRRRPEMFLRDGRVMTLSSYLDGYMHARSDLGVAEHGKGEEFLLSEFGDWLRGKSGAAAGVDWADQICDIDTSVNNAKTFFVLFEKFLSARGESLDRPPQTGWTDQHWRLNPTGER